MGMFVSPKATKVNATFISSVTTYGGVITSQGNTEPDGSYAITFRHDNGGCGNPDSGILILINDNISWTKIAFDWEGNGTASCWSFMNTGGSNYGATTGTSDGNMLQWSATNGDAIINPYLTWEVPEYQSHDRFYACDNNANNFFRFNSGSYKKFRMVRTRNSSGNLAGIHHGRSCNSTSAYTIIKNIYIW